MITIIINPLTSIFTDSSVIEVQEKGTVMPCPTEAAGACKEYARDGPKPAGKKTVPHVHLLMYKKLAISVGMFKVQCQNTVQLSILNRVFISVNA
ncbi:MAG: hypothetical protein ACYTFW_01875 [Planctomycetota bacterium]|jgi:hypothetical protein